VRPHLDVRPVLCLAIYHGIIANVEFRAHAMRPYGMIPEKAVARGDAENAEQNQVIISKQSSPVGCKHQLT